MTALSIVVPCYNEVACLGELHARVKAVAERVAPGDHEIVLVNDGSTDGSWAAMTALAARDPALVAVDLSRNHGHQMALTAGLDLCRGERVLIIDADLQDPPELLPDMIATMEREGADVVYAVRRHRSGETPFKRATASAFYRLLRSMTDTDIPVDTGDFRLMSRRALDTFLAMPEQARFIRGMVAWIGFRQVPIAYDRAERVAGSSKYPFGKMVRFALDALTGFSTAPLRLASHIGLALVAATVLLLGYVMIGWLVGGNDRGLDQPDDRSAGAGRGADVRAGPDRRVSGPPLPPGERPPALHRGAGDGRRGAAARAAGPAGVAPASVRRRDGGQRHAGWHGHAPDQIALGREHALQRGVHSQRRQGVVAVVVSPHPVDQPHARDRRE